MKAGVIIGLVFVGEGGILIWWEFQLVAGLMLVVVGSVGGAFRVRGRGGRLFGVGV